MSNKAKILEKLNRYEEAESLRKACFEAARDTKGIQDKLTRQALDDLIALYEKWGKSEKLSMYATFADSVGAN